MFRTIKIEVNAANPQMPLLPIDPFEGSAVSLVVVNVPRQFARREIAGVAVNVTNVAGVTSAFAATRSGSAWGVTVPAAAIGTSGHVENGVIISANGVNETGANVPCWILGAGDLMVKRQDGTITPGAVKRVMHWNDTRPANPVAGDVAPFEGAVYYFDGSSWVPFGGGGGIDLHDVTLNLGDPQNTINEVLAVIVRKGGGTVIE